MGKVYDIYRGKTTSNNVTTMRQIIRKATAKTPTDADRMQFEQAALAKYGTPASYTKGVGARWCNQGQVTGPNAVVCADNTPNLVLRGNELILGDNGIASRERDAWNKQGSGAPPL